MNQTPNQKNIVNAPITAGGNVIIGDTTYINNYFAAQEVKIPHRLTNNIPTNADHILGRATELAQTKEHLAQHQATVLFNGIGGIGKTALASKYMALYGSEYKHLAWITVQSTLAEAFIYNYSLLDSLQLTQKVQELVKIQELHGAFDVVFKHLNKLENALVVIDNANDLDDLDQYKNWFDTAHCHFLITSRNQPSEWATVEVDSLPEDEAVRLFKKLHPSVSSDDEAIKNLLSKLFYHTLLIELVAKTGATTGIPFTDLQTMIETQFIHHQSLNEKPIPNVKHVSMVATNPKKQKIEDYIWLIFNQVKGLDEGSKHLLRAMTLLPVATPFDLDFLKEHFAFFNISDAVVHIDALIERGWLQKEQTEEQKSYFKMHPLIADVVVKHLEINVDFADKYINRITDSIYYSDTDLNHNLFEKNKKKTVCRTFEQLVLRRKYSQCFSIT
jgi:NB-ARC domain